MLPVYTFLASAERYENDPSKVQYLKVSVPKTQRMELERLWQHQAGLPVSFLQWIGFPRARKNVTEGEVQDSINISSLHDPFTAQPPEFTHIKASDLSLQKSSAFFLCGAPHEKVGHHMF